MQPTFPPLTPAGSHATLLKALCCLAALLLAAPLFAAAAAVKRHYNLPADEAGEALKRFSQQSGRGVIVGYDLSKAYRTNAVTGEFSAEEAIERMLAGTGLIANQDRQSRAFAIRQAPETEAKNGVGALLKPDSSRPQESGRSLV